MQKAILFLIIIFFSCKNTESNNQSISLKNENSDLISEIKDSLFIGEPLVSNRNFIEEIFIGRENNDVRLKYESILKNRNSLFLSNKTEVNKVNVNEHLTLELKKNSSKNSQIILYTKINNIIKDSTTIFKIEQNKKKNQGILCFLENGLTLWKLETFSIKNENETYLGIKHWTKHKINPATGKIDLIEELNPASGVNEESSEANEVEDEENISNNKEINYSFNTLKGSWSYDCENASSLKINNAELVIPVIFNQYYIHLTRIDKKNDAGVFKYKLESMEGSGAEDETSKDYFNDTEIAIVKIIDNNTIEFNWLGFYNKSNKQRQYTDPHFGDQNPIILKKCEYGN